MSQVFGDRYEVVEQVGSGGMATVYKGFDTLLKRDVAIKVLHPHLAARDDARRRFNREAQAIARLHHPNIVDVYDFSDGSDEQAYLVTEFVQGETLTGFCRAHGPFLPQSTALICKTIAGALAHAHAQGIVHRDIKPDNLMISRDGKIKLMDFGIATAVDLEQMTATGAILGSPAHMAPEQIDGEDIDARVDVFAFGTLLYYLVTRRLPFMASNPHALFRLILECRFDPPSYHNPAVGRRFEEIVSTCMSRDRDDRFSSMAAVQDALDGYLRDHGMHDGDKLLSRLLTAPEQFELEWRPVLVQVLCAEGRTQAREGSLALAIDAYNRALAIDPNASEPKRGLNDLTSRSRRKKRLKAFATAAAGLALAFAGYHSMLWLRTAPTPAPPLPAAAVAVSPLPAVSDPGVFEPVPTVAPDAGQTGSEVLAADAGPRPPEPPVEIDRAPASAGQAHDDQAKVAADAPPVHAARPRVVTHKRRIAASEPEPEDKGPHSAGPKEVEPPSPQSGMITIGFGSRPPNAILYLDDELLSTRGHAQRSLRTGTTHTLRCKALQSLCGSCKEEVRAFKVPDKPPSTGKINIKCDFTPQMRDLGIPVSTLPR